MTRPGRYPQELWERAVRLVFEHQGEHPSQWAAICSIAHMFGVSAETLRKWVRRAETDDGLRPGLTSDERERLKTLEREVRELRRANEILKSAAAFSGRSSTADRRDDCLHRPEQGPVWGRADLPGAADRPLHLLRGATPPPTTSWSRSAPDGRLWRRGTKRRGQDQSKLIGLGMAPRLPRWPTAWPLAAVRQHIRPGGALCAWPPTRLRCILSFPHQRNKLSTPVLGQSTVAGGGRFSSNKGFVDPGDGHVHLLRNETMAPAETVAVQILPQGAARIDAADPGNGLFLAEALRTGRLGIDRRPPQPATERRLWPTRGPGYPSAACWSSGSGHT